MCCPLKALSCSKAMVAVFWICCWFLFASANASNARSVSFCYVDMYSRELVLTTCHRLGRDRLSDGLFVQGSFRPVRHGWIRDHRCQGAKGCHEVSRCVYSYVKKAGPQCTPKQRGLVSNNAVACTPVTILQLLCNVHCSHESHLPGMKLLCFQGAWV